MISISLNILFLTFSPVALSAPNLFVCDTEQKSNHLKTVNMLIKQLNCS